MTSSGEISVDEPTEFIPIDGVRRDDMVDVSGRVEFVNVEAKDTLPTCNYRLQLEIRAWKQMKSL